MKLRGLNLLIEPAGFGKAICSLGGISVDACLGARLVLLYRERQATSLALSPLRAAGSRRDMRGVADKKEPSEPHRFGKEAAQRRMVFSIDVPVWRTSGSQRVKAASEFVPESIVRPIVDLVETALAPQGR